MTRFHLKCFVYLIVFIMFSPARADGLVEMFRAVHLDDARTVKRLLAQGVDPNALNDKGQPALFVAMRDESAAAAAALLEHPNIQPDLANATDETPLMMAALRGNLALAEALLARGVAVNRSGWAPLHYAATGPETAMVALLLQRGAALEAGAPNGSTALMMACRFGPESSVDLLLARGASLKAANAQGLTAVDFASSVGRESLVRRLAAAAR